MAHQEPGQSGRRATVAALTDAGPREVNEDRMFTSMSTDGAWVIAVADGLGGQTRSDEAAQAAVDSLPERIDSKGAMEAVFTVAHERVLALSGPLRDPYRWAPLSTFPMTTLCVAAWTPEGGLLIGWMRHAAVRGAFGTGGLLGILLRPPLMRASSTASGCHPSTVGS